MTLETLEQLIAAHAKAKMEHNAAVEASRAAVDAMERTLRAEEQAANALYGYINASVKEAMVGGVK